MADEFLAWKDDWNTDIPEIDRQHRTIADQLNLIVAMLEKGETTDRDGRELDDALSRLLMLTREHFSSEEVQMQLANYPGYVSHKMEHVMLQAELTQYVREIMRKHTLPDMDTLKSLKHWFVAHMVTDDKVFAMYYRESQ